nr:putative lysosomal acid lipase [Arabidopsis thaliana]
MKWLLVAVLTSLTIFSALTQSHLLHGSPVNSLCADLIHPANYSCTEHSIQTKDGYILALQRVASLGPRLQSGPPVLLQHGLFMAGDVWFLNSPKESLGFILADHGFDVWVGNVRGTRYSYGHVTLSDTDKEFWDWSWQDLAMYDLAEMIQYLYSISNSKIFLVGHSQGTIMSFAALTQPHVAEMVEAAALLCPISYLDHVTAPLVERMVFMHLDQIEYYLDYEPHPSSVKNIRHLFQMIRKGTFAQYDYGYFKNLRTYGLSKPPEFILSHIPASLPMWMGYGGTDGLADVTDVEHTLAELPSSPELLYLEDYGHIDFVLGSSAKEDVYKHMIQFFRAKVKSSSW